MDCADYRIHSDCTADSTGYNLLYGLSPDSVTISPCKSITLSRGFWFTLKNHYPSDLHVRFFRTDTVTIQVEITVTQ